MSRKNREGKSSSLSQGMGLFLRGKILFFFIFSLLILSVFLMNRNLFLAPNVGAENKTPSPTSSPNQLPECLGLSASPKTGGAVLNVSFAGSGDDPDGKIMAFEFNFGDGQQKLVEGDFGGSANQNVSHPYGNPGVYQASLRVRDNNGDFSETGDSCKATINVTGEVLGAVWLLNYF